MIKKGIAALLCALLLVASLAGCGAEQKGAEEEKLRIVATIFPIYDWVREIIGDAAEGAELTLLLDGGVDLHSYQPTADDLITISRSDLFLYVGGESDEWVEDVLHSANNPNLRTLNLMEVLGDGAKEEETVEGMEESEHHHDEEEHEGEEEHEEEETEYDEHVWLSLQNAALFCETIAEQLGEADPANRDAYAANAADYVARLNAMDEAYRAVVDAAARKTVLFGDRFPFRYLTDDYGLRYYAAFSGCSAESEASFETVIFLAGKVDELGLPAVLTIESSDGKIARTIVENTAEKSAQVLQMDSMQSTTLRDAESGARYLDAMEHNLDVLRQALQ